MAGSNPGSIVITGANGGLGIAIAQQLTSRPELAKYYGLYLVRDETCASPLHQVLAGFPTHQREILSMDLTQMDSIRQTAGRINSDVSAGTIPPVQVLILNAGYQNLSNQTWGSDGLDPTFTVNYLGHWLLVLLLLKSLDRECARIVVVGSQVHDPYSKLNRMIKPSPFPEEALIVDRESVDAIAKGAWSPMAEDWTWFSGYRRYGAAKLCAMMMAHELQHRLSQDAALGRIRVLAVDPGYMNTGLQRHGPWIVRLFIFPVLFPIGSWLIPNGPIRTTRTSALHILEAAFDSVPGPGEPSIALYFDGAKPAETSVESRDPCKRDLVWKESIRLTNLQQGETILGNWQ